MNQNALTFVAARPPASAATLLDGLAAQDFPALQEALAPDVHLRALLPGGLREWTGAEAVAGRFGRWFGHTEQFASVEGSADLLGERIRLRWRVRLRAERLGPGWFVVEQVAYCDTDEVGRITRMDLLCSGYLSEACDD